MKALKCELEMLNFFLCKKQFDKEKLVPPKALAQAEQNLEEELDREVQRKLRALEDTVRTPVLDSLQANYTTAFFLQNKMSSAHVVVRKLPFPTELPSPSSQLCPLATLRISKSSTFYALWKAACSYWVVSRATSRGCT